MKLSDKLARVETELKFLAGHDAEPVAQVRAALRGVIASAKAHERALVQRRVGSVVSRVKAYFVGLVSAFRGRS